MRRGSGRNAAEQRLWKELRGRAYERDQGCCVVCGGSLNPEHWECHHRKKRSQGGLDELCNVISVHPLSCHFPLIHNQPKDAYAKGWLVPRDGDPSAVAALYYRGGLVLLTNDEVAA